MQVMGARNACPVQVKEITVSVYVYNNLDSTEIKYVPHALICCVYELKCRLNSRHQTTNNENIPKL